MLIPSKNSKKCSAVFSNDTTTCQKMAAAVSRLDQGRTSRRRHRHEQMNLLKRSKNLPQAKSTDVRMQTSNRRVYSCDSVATKEDYTNEIAENGCHATQLDSDDRRRLSLVMWELCNGLYSSCSQIKHCSRYTETGRETRTQHFLPWNCRNNFYYCHQISNLFTYKIARDLYKQLYSHKSTPTFSLTPFYWNNFVR